MTVAMPNSRFFQSWCVMVAMFAVIAHGPVRQVSKCLLSTPQPRAVVPGSHCPLMRPFASQSQSSPQHCPMHRTARQQHSELHCACSQPSPASSPEFASLRFVLPPAVSSLVPPVDVFQGRDPCIFLPQVFLSPPILLRVSFPSFSSNSVRFYIFGHSSPQGAGVQALSASSSEHALDC
jgi:hypothetical protein